jgi:hypothetical protein
MARRDGRATCPAVDTTSLLAPPAQPSGLPSSERPALAATDGAALAAVALVGTAWLAVPAGLPSPGALGALAASLAAWWLAGTVLAGTRVLRGLIPWGLPATLLLGFAVVNTSLFLLAWATPFPIGGNFALIAAAIAGVTALRRPRLERGGMESVPGVVAVLVAVAGATLWARDTLVPIEPGGATALVKPWLDAFYHAAHVRLFGDARGAATIEDFRMAGFPARLYHYASYLTPGLVRTAGGLSGYQVFTGLLVPLGLFMTGLGAATLAGAWWGGWAGVGAVAALLLMPDGYQLGGGNPFLGYHWMQQVGPAGAYGVALLALAWALLLGACRQGRRASLLVSWMVGALVIVYKAQFFVAAAFLLWTLPPLLFAGLSRRHRIAWLVVALACFEAGVVVTQRVPALPGIWLDGSSTEHLLGSVFRWADPGPVTDLFSGRFGPSRPWLVNLGWGGAYLLVAVLGLWGLAWAGLAVALRRRMDRVTLLLPAVFTANFLVMALGLAMDQRGVGTPEELLHRPFVWAYFVTAAWTGGTVAWLLVQPGPARRGRRLAGAVALGALLFVPLAFDRRVQALDRMGIAYVTVPAGLVEVPLWLGAHAAPRSVFQDSGYDVTYLLTALSDLRPYVDGSFIQVAHGAEESQRRMAAVIGLRKARDAATVRAVAAELGIDWFVLQPGDAVWWPSVVVDHPAFQSGGIRVYRLR